MAAKKKSVRLEQIEREPFKKTVLLRFVALGCNAAGIVCPPEDVSLG